MEALIAVQVALLAIYDMRVVEKHAGASWRAKWWWRRIESRI